MQGSGPTRSSRRWRRSFDQTGPGLLVHPVWRTVSAYFVTLELMEEPLPDYVRYRFFLLGGQHTSGGLVEVP